MYNERANLVRRERVVSKVEPLAPKHQKRPPVKLARVRRYVAVRRNAKKRPALAHLALVLRHRRVYFAAAWREPLAVLAEPRVNKPLHVAA